MGHSRSGFSGSMLGMLVSNCTVKKVTIIPSPAICRTVSTSGYLRVGVVEAS